MSKKTININPDLFSTSKKSSKSKTRKAKPLPLVSPNVMKRNLLQKIKEHKERNSRPQVDHPEEIGKFTSEFQDSMDYLKGLASNSSKNTNDTNRQYQAPNNQYRAPNNQYQAPNNQYQAPNNQFRAPNNQYQAPNNQRATNRTSHNKSLKNPYAYKPNTPNYGVHNPPDYNFAPVELDFPEEPMIFNTEQFSMGSTSQPPHENTMSRVQTDNLKIPEVPYGCLKNGMKPTYRNWVRKTQKLSDISKMNVVPPTPEEVDRLKMRLNQNLQHGTSSGGNPKFKKKYLIKRKSRKRYKLGKQKHNRTISVLIKGSTMRKKINQEKIMLSKKSIHDIKNYLKKHGLLKAGSSCPEDVLRKMYESTILTGYVKNNNKDVLLHNFLND